MRLHELRSVHSWLVERVSSRGVGPKMNNDRKPLGCLSMFELIGGYSNRCSVFGLSEGKKTTGKRLENCLGYSTLKFTLVPIFFSNNPGSRKRPLLATKLIFQGPIFRFHDCGSKSIS